MKWCFDTSALVEPWVRLYPPDVMGSVWDKLEELADAEIIGAPIDVLIELERKDDDLYKWARAQTRFFIEPDRALAERTAEITNAFPGFVKPNSTKSACDPWVVALAEIHQVPVVNYETLGKANGAPKIPNVCNARGLQSVRLIEVLRAEGFSAP